MPGAPMSTTYANKHWRPSAVTPYFWLVMCLEGVFPNLSGETFRSRLRSPPTCLPLAMCLRGRGIGKQTAIS